jgi:hypothetical protein
MNSFSKGGVYGTRKTGQAFDGAEDRHVAPLEEDCRDHIDRLEEGGTFRRQLFEITSSVSASG